MLIPKVLTPTTPHSPQELISEALLSPDPLVKQLAIIADALLARRHDKLGWC